jgi:hypothetical protein
MVGAKRQGGPLFLRGCRHVSPSHFDLSCQPARMFHQVCLMELVLELLEIEPTSAVRLTNKCNLR